MNFSLNLVKWYNNNKRDLPWRKTRDPYKIWLSEIILQQVILRVILKIYPRVRNLLIRKRSAVRLQ
jgi:A/G-specific adenine glycosylase